MSETAGIAELAVTVGKEIFEVFKWEITGPSDHRWDCVEKEKHAPGKKKSVHVHPSDAVFFYTDPYLGKTAYVTTDFKSYATNSLSGFPFKKDILSLVNSVECAHKSETFQELYVDGSNPWFVEGMLFVYNHDGEYDKDFRGSMLKNAPKQVSLLGRQRMFVFGPKDIWDFYSIATDLDSRLSKVRRNEDVISDGFFVPDSMTKVVGPKTGAATLEMLSSPWLFHEMRTESVRHVSVYVRELEDDKDEFKYLIDAILQYQLLSQSSKIVIRALNASSETIKAINSAHLEYTQESHGILDFSAEMFAKRMKGISIKSLPITKPSFCELELASRDA
ncbi:MAG: hypothetical protein AAGC74_02675 [Verrucomicrobiota bacterium]